MIARQKWVEHQFNLGIHPGWAQNIVSRLSDTEIRLKSHSDNLSDKILSQKDGDSWSIKEHIGHLVDLEELHIKRLQEFSKLKETLSPADMLNIKTEDANHNAKAISMLVDQFSEARAKLIATFYSFDDTVQQHEAFHARLGLKMKPVDMLFFTAEHDDHHIASIIEIKKNMGL